MRILFSPQVRSDNVRISYKFEGEVITATIGDLTDVFDFSSFPDGDVDFESIETILPYQPIERGMRENGVLSVRLLNFISIDATDEEKFPQWIEV